eukprot:TRINITY_DN9856_c0_g1_i1.p1 TRINITY_DN9856_c0_g1~~TRINITY_DN9856_c0_g1_i1.p1  ORF type:complete len:541 (+),score=117.50 TRINITY_DN9856_c0_g1_i1:840-2462(+)
MSMKRKAAVYVALDDYTAQNKNEISFTKNDKFKVLKQNKNDEAWWNVQNLSTKKKGFVPASMLTVEGSLELHEWCHGAISRNGADYLLKQHGREGMYLVRESQSQPGQYTLDVWSGGKTVHYRITLGDDGYFFRQGVCFATIPELIEHHQTKADGLCCVLSEVAPKAHAKTVVISMDLDRKWELKRSDVELGPRLGGGNYGEVYRGTYNKQTVAVKTIKEESMETVEFMKEAHVMKKLNHPNLVKLIGVCSQDLPMYIVQEFVCNGDLLTYLRRPQSRTEIDHISMLYLATQIAAGMSALEDQNTIHRDLAARNCLVGENLAVKVADFGMGRVVDDLYTARTGTKMPIKWTSPEALCYDAFSVKSDVWSFGITLWEIATYGDNPYPGMEARDVITQLEQGYRMPEPDNCPEGLYEVMVECWALKSDDRPSFHQLTEKLDDLHKESKGWRNRRTVLLAASQARDIAFTAILQYCMHGHTDTRAHAHAHHACTISRPVSSLPLIVQASQRLPSAVPRWPSRTPRGDKALKLPRRSRVAIGTR